MDGGNTKTIALAARLDGLIIGEGRSGCGDIYNQDEFAALDAVMDAIRQSLASEGAQPADVAAIALSLAGADWPEDFDYWHTAMRERGFTHTLIVNDAMGALRAGSPDGTGVAIACGTGAGTGARSVDGRIWHSSFWQMTQGAEELSRKVRKAVYLAELGIGPASTLTQRVLDAYSAPSIEAVLHAETRRQNRSPSPIGKLSRALMEEARSGDQVALSIIQKHGAELTEYGLVAARKVGLEGAPFYLILAGSLLRETHSPLASAIIDKIVSVNPLVQPIMSQFEPAVGALFLALEQMGAIIDDQMLARLRPSLPPASLFET